MPFRSSPDAARILSVSSKLQSRIRRTPLHRTPSGVWLKREDLQVSGSFKARGVWAVALDCLSRGELQGLACVSTGNTARAAAHVSRSLGVGCVAIVPEGASRDRVMAIRQLGCRVIETDLPFSSAAIKARHVSSDLGYAFCSPGAQWEFALGVASLGLEISSARPTHVVTPVGGGGLAVGLAIGMASSEEGAPSQLVGVQAEGSTSVLNWWDPTRALPISETTLAQCLAGDLEKGALVRRLGRDVFSQIDVVSDETMLSSMWTLKQLGCEIELGAAAGFSSAEELAVRDPNAKVICVLTSDAWGSEGEAGVSVRGVQL